MALLEVREVTKKFGQLVANDRISFSVEEGSIVGLIGPNGAGKTTLFNCISGLFKPEGGQVVFDGKDITGEPPYRIARMGAVRTFQVVRPLKDMSVLENVLVGAFLRTSDRGEALTRAEECLRLCNLTAYRDRMAGDLPIGGKKRLEMARALATGPRLLMLDEVMAGLNTTELKAALDVILRLRDSGITLMVVEHVMEGIMPIADKVVVLDGGTKIAEDIPARIVRDERVIEAYLGAKYGRRLKNGTQGGSRD